VRFFLSRAARAALALFLPFAAAAQAPAPAAPEPRFALLEFEIEGNTVLPVQAVERAVLPHLGESRSLADVEAARTALERAYQDAGHLTVIVDVPEQRVDAGVVVLRVLEGRIERLVVTGARHMGEAVVAARVPELAPGRVPDFGLVQQQLAAAQTEQRRLQPVLRPGTAQGTVEAELRVEERTPWSGSVELNNRHAAETEPWRLVATARRAALLDRDVALALTAITAPQASEQSRVLVANATLPLNAVPQRAATRASPTPPAAAFQHTLLASLTLSDSVVEPLAATTVFGAGTTLSLRWLATLAGAEALHTFALGADWKDVRERVAAGTGEVATPVRYLPLVAGWNASWFGEAGALTTLATTLTFGTPFFARDVPCPGTVGEVDQFACKRQGAEGRFATVRADLRHRQAVLEGRPAAGTLALRAAAQWASMPVIGNEQFALGGADTVRGYLEAEASGDHALLASLEWQSGRLLGGEASQRPWIDELSVLAFLDAGRARVLQPALGQSARQPLAGTGVGLRLRARQRFAAELDLAWPLVATPATRTNRPRLHVRLQASF
jgi:hemolysin activation/secretion protein